MTVTSLNNYSFAFNNFVFGGANSPYQITAVDGLASLPSLRVQDADRGYQDGMFSGRDFLGGRTVTITMLVLGGNGNSAQQNFALIQAALVPQQTGTTPLQFQLSTATSLQRVNARVRSRSAIIDPEFTYGYIKAQYTFYCPDPRFYDDTLQTATLVSSQPLGRTYNRVYPLTYGGGQQTNTALITNSGWTATYPVITINGPLGNPSVGNLTTGVVLSFNYTMTNLDVLTIDLDARTILLNGTPARNYVTGTSNWFSAAPGANAFYFTGVGATAGVTQATITWRNAYI